MRSWRVAVPRHIGSDQLEMREELSYNMRRRFFVQMVQLQCCTCWFLCATIELIAFLQHMQQRGEQGATEKRLRVPEEVLLPAVFEAAKAT